MTKFVFTVPNNGNEVYSDDSICIELNTTMVDCLPLGGSPRCYQRQVVRETQTDRLAFSITIDGNTIYTGFSETLLPLESVHVIYMHVLYTRVTVNVFISIF